MTKKSFSGVVIVACGALLVFAPGGCPSEGNIDEIRGSTGDQPNVGDTAAVEVFDADREYFEDQVDYVIRPTI